MSTRTPDAQLDVLSASALTPGSAEPDAAVRLLAWDGHSPQSLAAAWSAFRQSVVGRHQLLVGARDWRDADPEATGLHDAVRRADERTAEAYEALTCGRQADADIAERGDAAE